MVVGAAVRDQGKLCFWHQHWLNPPDRPELADHCWLGKELGGQPAASPVGAACDQNERGPSLKKRLDVPLEADFVAFTR